MIHCSRPYLRRSPMTLGSSPRSSPIRVYRFLRKEAGLAVHESQNLLAGGMLITTMMGLRVTDDCDRDPSSRELLTAVFAERPDLMRSRTEPEPERELKRETEA